MRTIQLNKINLHHQPRTSASKAEMKAPNTMMFAPLQQAKQCTSSPTPISNEEKKSTVTLHEYPLLPSQRAKTKRAE
ncbi:hypothetical protein VIGAN_06071000 [Vigna angularis var. angularis]|uniref:Uncharacterized protein n=1 Tax=Vigna angularis var. angularis TaxID=157739 RepID=A0A0S3SA65_PHAAN|nr:hypothetical protein VIGAN_06071000 [Vigna angularis var. angularis]